MPDTKPLTAWMWLRDINSVCHFYTREKGSRGAASNSELKRWLQNGAVVVNGEKVAWDEVMDFPIISVVLFPKNPITLW